MSFKPAIVAEGLPAAPAEPAFEELLGTARNVESDPSKQDRAGDDARRKTLRTLNAVKIVSPIMAAVVEKYSGAGSETDSIAFFKRLVIQASEMSEQVVKGLGADPVASENFWLRNMLERSFCEMLRDQVQRGKEGSLKALEPFLMTVVEMDLPHHDVSQKFENWSVETVVRSAIFRACAPIIAKASNFDFFRKDPDKDFEEIAKLLMRVASEATLKLADKAAGEKERASLFSVLIAEAGVLYASAWQACGKQVVTNLSNLSNKELQALLAENPEGLPLDGVQESFEKNFNRLVSMSAKLVPQKAGRIDVRAKSENGKS